MCTYTSQYLFFLLSLKIVLSSRPFRDYSSVEATLRGNYGIVNWHANADGRIIPDEIKTPPIRLCGSRANVNFANIIGFQFTGSQVSTMLVVCADLYKFADVPPLLGFGNELESKVRDIGDVRQSFLFVPNEPTRAINGKRCAIISEKCRIPKTR